MQFTPLDKTLPKKVAFYINVMIVLILYSKKYYYIKGVLC
jgi:hypothetical protein